MRWYSFGLIVGLLWACAPDAELGPVGEGGRGGEGGVSDGGGGASTVASAGGGGGLGGGSCAEGAEGEILWATSFGGVQDETVLALDGSAECGFALGLWSLTPGTIDFGSGAETGNAFVARFDASRTPSWSAAARASAGATAGVEAVAFASDGTLFAGATFTGTLTGDYTATATVTDVLFARHDTSGAVMGSDVITNAGLIRILGLETLSDGRFAACGFYNGDLTIAQSHDDGGANKWFVALFNADLSPVWSKTYGVTSAVPLKNICRIAVDSADNIHLVGGFDQTIDFDVGPVAAFGGALDPFFVKLTSAGSVLEETAYFGTGQDFATAAAAYTDAGAIVAGRFSQDISLGNFMASSPAEDVFLVRLGPTYEPVWSKHYMGIGNEEITGVAVDPSGDIVIVGYHDDDFMMDAEQLLLEGTRSGFVAKLTATGAIAWTTSLVSSGSVLPRAVTIGSNGVITVAGTFSGTVEAAGQRLESSGTGDAFVMQIAP